MVALLMWLSFARRSFSTAAPLTWELIATCCVKLRLSLLSNLDLKLIGFLLFYVVIIIIIIIKVILLKLLKLFIARPTTSRNGQALQSQ